METLIGGTAGLVIGVLMVLTIGAVVGWLASLLVPGTGLGVWGHVFAGCAGGILAGFLLPSLTGTGMPDMIYALLASVAGAVAVLICVRL